MTPGSINNADLNSLLHRTKWSLTEWCSALPRSYYSSPMTAETAIEPRKPHDGERDHR